jgi:hypothetical protein
VKKVSAILLIALILFNLLGYRLVFSYVQNESDKQLEASLDKNDFDEAELITIKVPISVPYQTDKQNFERVDGELKVNGKIYRYVKRKVADGQLILLCLPDHKKMQLQSAKDEFFKYTNDLVQNNSSKKSDRSKSGIFKNDLSEYEVCSAPSFTSSNGSGRIRNVSRRSDLYPSSPHSSPEQPPEI